MRRLTGLVALASALVSFAVPAVRLKQPALILVPLIGVAAMVYSFIENLRGGNHR